VMTPLVASRRMVASNQACVPSAQYSSAFAMQ
jgi:hypothetical protein